MKTSFFAKLYVTFLVLILVTVGVLDLAISSVWKRSLRAQMEQDLQHTVAVLAADLDTHLGGSPRDLTGFADRIGQVGKMRVTIVDARGIVLVDSEASAEKMENHASRPEFLAALNGRTAVAERTSATTGVPYLYAAAPLRGGAVRVARPLVQIEQSVSLVQRNLAMTSFGIMVLAALLAGWAAHSLSQRLQRITAFASQVSAGDLSARIPSSGRDELGQVAEALNTTAGKLEWSFAEVQSTSAQLETLLNSMQEAVIAVGEDRRVRWANGRMDALASGGVRKGQPVVESFRDPELLRAIDETLESQQVRSARAELVSPGRVFQVTTAPLPSGGAVAVLHEITEVERVEKTRRDFIANVSHELRTPLTSIQGYAETLLEIEQDRNAREFLEIIRKNGLRMSRLTEDLLALARVESGEEEFRLRPVSPATLLKDAEESFQEMAKVRNQWLEIDNQATALVLADPDKIHQVFANLIENGLKYSAAGTKVVIGARDVKVEGAGAVEFFVNDNGPGIASEHLPRLFERFYRVDRARSRESGGTGLGLAIAKHIILKHRGRIRAESELNRGSSFLFELPIAAPGASIVDS